MSRRLLFVSYISPPHLCPTSIHLVRLLRYLPRTGWKATLLTADARATREPLDPDLAIDAAADVEVVATRPSEGRLREGLLRRIHPGLLELPDPKVLWALKGALAGLRQLRRRPVDAIVSYSHYLTSHLAGGLIARWTGLPWVAFCSDPWTDNPLRRRHRGWMARVDGWLERSVFLGATRLIFTSPETVDLVARRYPAEFRSRCRVYPHGFDATEFPVVPAPATPRALPSLVHVGNFYGTRTPEPLIGALLGLRSTNRLPPELAIDLYGGLDPSWQQKIQDLGLGTHLRHHGPVSYAEGLKCMAAADALVLVDSPAPEVSVFLPQKLMDYLGAARPILGITPAVGASARVLRETGHPCLIPEDIEGIAGMLLDVAVRGTAALGRAAVDPTAIRSYETRHNTELLGQLLDEVVAERR